MIDPTSLQITSQEWQGLMPLVIVGVGSMVALLAATLFPSNAQVRKLGVFATGVATLLGAIGWTIMHWQAAPIRALQGALLFDAYSSFFFVLLGISGLLALLAGFRYLEREGIHFSEYYALFLSSVLGMMCLLVSVNLVAIFIALELMSLAVYVLVGMRRLDKYSNEASAKYFVMGGLGGAVFLYGAAMIYGASGTTNLTNLAEMLAAGQLLITNPLLVVGVGLVLVGFFFKIAAVPFHMWSPDVYEGAPVVITSFMSTALKAAAFAALVRFTAVFFGEAKTTNLEGLAAQYHSILWWLALITMIVGNLLALQQKNLKRMLAYSAIAHTGYLVLGVMVGGQVGYSSILIYLVPYTLMNIGAFTILGAVSGKSDREATIDSFVGLGFKKPFLCGAMALFLFSLSGLPPTGGFIGKYFLFTAGLQAGEVGLVLAAVIASLVSVFYYLRVVVAMYMRQHEASAKPTNEQPLGAMAAFVVGVCALFTVVVGVYPGALLKVARSTSASVVQIAAPLPVITDSPDASGATPAEGVGAVPAAEKAGLPSVEAAPAATGNSAE